MSNVSKQELHAALQMTVAVAEAVKAAGPNGIPAGTVYAVLMDRVDLPGFQGLVRVLVRAGAVEEKGNVLQWTGKV